MRKIFLFTVAALICMPLAAQEPRRNLKLSVRNPKGKAVPELQLAASLKGDSTAVRLDRYGNRFFKITDSDTLCVILERDIYEIPLAGLDSVYLVFKGKRGKGSKKNEDVFDVGYGTVSKSNATTSVGYLNMAGVDGYTDLKSYLEGRVAGVYFAGNKLIIRGMNSIHGNVEALIVLDGAMLPSFEEANGMVNPRDIESISVLKDGGAAIYGSSGANGVVLITTKKGNQPKE